VRAKPFSKAECRALERRAGSWPKEDTYAFVELLVMDDLLATIRSLRRELALVKRGYWLHDPLAIHGEKALLMKDANAIQDRREGKK